MSSILSLVAAGLGVSIVPASMQSILPARSRIARSPVSLSLAHLSR